MVYIRPINDNDVDIIYPNLINRTVMYKNFMPYRMVSANDIMNTFAKKSTDLEMRNSFIVCNDKNPIGLLSFEVKKKICTGPDIDYIVFKFSLDWFELLTDGVKALCYYLFNDLGYKKVSISVPSPSKAFIYELKTLGFTDEAYLSEYRFVNNNYVDIIRLGLSQRVF